jgi:hypothetical protein
MAPVGFAGADAYPTSVDLIIACGDFDFDVAEIASLPAFNNRAHRLIQVATRSAQRAGLYTKKERREVKALGHAVVSTDRFSTISIGRLVTVSAQRRNSA